MLALAGKSFARPLYSRPADLAFVQVLVCTRVLLDDPTNVGGDPNADNRNATPDDGQTTVKADDALLLWAQRPFRADLNQKRPAYSPPSTARAVPVTKLEQSPARNTTASANSSGRPNRCNGMFLILSCATSASLNPRFAA